MEPPVPPQEQPPRPRSHTVTTTSSSFTANLSASSSTLAYDREFLRTVPGLLMVTEIVLGLLVWTLIAGTEYFLYPAFGWVMFVAVFYWVLTVFFLIIYMTMTYTRIPQVPWTMVWLHPMKNESVAASELTDLAICLKQQESLLESTPCIRSRT
ncbi:CKLF-like MARVEL transmembrane domain-containing protein 8 isoform X2 [Corvus hawaiiensis]|uniref:CKLF-like MARVEL transmembrane domain-containing protein 8 isoform X2 n=1 Tax=Corvus kubaryi TaxID=68294 RepID=UPI001C04EF2F|nr:CKLF-like MARVEL transmembrane domain-containing protein 8 isoform X2 [Corvus kubaryi]XP_048157259.1 CKLF-like MARVEL transmembrane domain-containing protein 8 isoform X2 [Corvus hawaiiensis]